MSYLLTAVCLVLIGSSKSCTCVTGDDFGGKTFEAEPLIPGFEPEFPMGSASGGRPMRLPVPCVCANERIDEWNCKQVIK